MVAHAQLRPATLCLSRQYYSEQILSYLSNKYDRRTLDDILHVTLFQVEIRLSGYNICITTLSE